MSHPAELDWPFFDDSHREFKTRLDAWCTEHLKKLAAEMCDKRIVSMLEGGYVMSSLARSVGAHLRVLADL